MGNRSSKKHAKLPATTEGAEPSTDPETAGNNENDQPKKKKEKAKLEKAKKEKEKKEKKEKAEKEKKEKKEKAEKEKKEKKEKSKKEKKKKDKKEKKKSKNKSEYEELPRQTPEISDFTNSIDVTNFNGDTRNLEDAVTISVQIETTDPDNMRGKENTRPISEGRMGRPPSPKGPGVSALREKFGAKATGTPCRPVSYPASRLQNDSPKGELHQPVHRKSFGFNRLEETPQKEIGKSGIADGNVSALKMKFGGTNAGTPPSPTSKATPSKIGGVANKWQPKQSTPSETKTTSRTQFDQAVTPTTTTTTATTGIGALRNRFNSNSDDRTSVTPAGHTIITQDKKRRKADDEKSAGENIEKENEKNKSPRKHWRDWSPKKEAKTPSRETSPTKETSPRKRKSVVLNRFNNIAKSKSKQDHKDEVEESPLISRGIVDNRDEEAEKERARQLIANRTSALIHGSNSTPKTTPSRVQFEESVPKRTRRDEKPKERPKTEYNFQSVPSPRPKSVADTNQLFSTPVSVTPAKGNNIIKNPTTKTQKLLQWCQINTQGYDGVCVSNFSSSWSDGLAFCALVHKFFPNAFNFNTLTCSNRRHNFDLAFSSAEKYANVPCLLETADMIEMGDKPDWKCVFTYVTSLYAGLNKCGK